MLTRPLTQPLTGPLVRGVGEGGVGQMLPTPTRFVSNSASNGYASGANTGTGATKAAPWLTLDYAIANATAGDVIEVNAGTYQSATFFNAGKTLTVFCRSPNAVTLQAADTQTRIVNVNPTTSTTLTLINLLLDGRGNTTRGVTVGNGPSLGVVSGLTMRNCAIQGVTQEFIEAGSVFTAGINLSSLTLSGAISTRCLFFQAQEGSISVSGVTLNGVSTTAANYFVFTALRAAGSSNPLTVSVRGVQGTFTGPANSVTDGIVLTNIDNGLIESNNLSLAGTGTSSGALYKVFSNSATLTANNATVRSNTGNVGHAGGGYGVLIGTDSSGAGNGNQNDPLIENNTLTANAASTQPIHGYILSWGSGGTVRNNTITGAGHGLLAKDWTGGTFSGNAASGFSSEGIYAKGATNTTFSGNILNVTVANSGAAVKVGIDDASLNSTGITVSGNVLNINVDPPQVVSVGTSNTATFSGNTYNINTTLAGATPWSYQGTGYASLAAWKAAKEPDAIP